MSDLSSTVWEKRYQTGDAPWDLGFPAPPFVNLLSSPEAPETGRIAVLGCGGGHDAMLFAEAGFEVVGFDFAQTAIDRANARANDRGIAGIQFLKRDIFDLETEFASGFDYVLEHTCFCAIDPELRSRYVQLIHTILKSQGQLISIFYTHNRSGGPPFGVKPQEILDYFEPQFDRILFQPAIDSIDRRKGDEYLGIFQVRK